MSKNLTPRYIIILIVLAWALVTLWPSIKFQQLSPDDIEDLEDQIEEITGKDNQFLPENACPLEEVEVDVETGQVDLVNYTGVTDCGTVLHPRSLRAQGLGGSIQGIGMAMSQKWVFDPVWGVSFANRLYTARPPGILDVPSTLDWAAVEIPDPQNPVGAKGIGEPPVGAGSAAMTSAIADALGGKCLCRTPLTADVILAEIEGQEPAYGPLDIHV